MDFIYTFPAIKGIQAGKEYYSTMIPLKLLDKLFIFNEDVDDIPAEYRAQRNLNIARVPQIAQYILSNRNSYVFSSLTASIDGKMNFTKINNSDLGYLSINMDAKFLINDGQHRKAAIKYALEKDPSLMNETISIVLFRDNNLKNSQQMFSDLNRYAVIPNKSIGLLYDYRDPMAIASKNIINKVKLFKYYTDKEKASLAKFSTKLFTLSNIYEANKNIIGNKKIDEKFLINFWNAIFENIKEFEQIIKKEITSKELRENYVLGCGTWLEGIGLVGSVFYEKQIDFYKQLKNLNKINWSRKNPNWINRIIQNGRISKNNFAIKLTANLIKKELGLPLIEGEIFLEKGININDRK